MKNDTFNLEGILTRTLTVGYRSPYRLRVSDPSSLERLSAEAGLDCEAGKVLELELRGDVNRLKPLIGSAVRVLGVYRVVPGGPAPAGSEAAARFVGGIIPTLAWFEVSDIEAVA